MRILFTRRTVALLAIALGVASSPASAQSNCQSGKATIQVPYASGFTIPSSFQVSVNAGTSSPCTLTRIRLYVDGQAYGLSREFNAPGGSVVDAEFTIDLNEGYHNLVAVAYNSAGYAFASPSTQVFSAPVDKKIYIIAPKSGATVNSPVTIGARGRWDGSRYYLSQIQHMRVYVDNIEVYDIDSDHLMFQKSFSPGRHHLLVIAWTQSGQHIEASEYFDTK